MPSFCLPNAHGYLVALSGGADSRLLLELTVRATLSRRSDEGAGTPTATDSPAEALTGPDPTTPANAPPTHPDILPPPRIVAAHLHHGIRGAEADRDEAFCRRICAALGVPLVVEHADVPALAAASGRSTETEAREARYAFFRRVMAEEGLSVLLTAHHADDQLETVLHHLLRGSGTRGMGGIPPMRPLDAPSTADMDAGSKDADAPMIFRPLLAWTRRDILAAGNELGLDYVTDSSNLTPDCTRNRLRLDIIPVLEAMTGEGVPQRAAGRLASAAREDDEALTAIAQARYEAAVSAGGECVLSEAEADAFLAKIKSQTGVGRTMSPTEADDSYAVSPTEADDSRAASSTEKDGSRAECQAGRGGLTRLPVAAVRAEPAAIGKRMIALAYAAFYRQMGEFHRNDHRGSTAQNRAITGGDFGGKPAKPAASAPLPPDRTLSAYHLEALLVLCRAGREGAVSDLLPGDVRASVQGGRLVFRRPEAYANRVARPQVATPLSSVLLVEGVTVWGGVPDEMAEADVDAEAAHGDVPAMGILEGGTIPVITVEVTRMVAPCAPDAGEDVWASAVFPAAVLDAPLLLRRREAGDVILSHGMNKKIKKLLCDKHIPVELRDRLPLVCLCDGTPLWVPGVAFRDGYPAPETGEAARVTVRLGRGDVAPAAQ